MPTARSLLSGYLPDPGYLALRAAGYHFDDHGTQLGDKRRDRQATMFSVHAHDQLLGYVYGMKNAYLIALRHYHEESSHDTQPLA